ncbi:Cyclic nucleotide-gated ion channel 1 [Hirschfeldia incana]|nr:Cyclic nucleotide-gated ion channel 1 [Hirschfeldia incana]
MTFRPDKSVKFQDWKSDKTSDVEHSERTEVPAGLFRRAISSISDKFHRSSAMIKMFRPSSHKSYSFKEAVSKGIVSTHEILDPQGPFLQRWNKIFVLACIIAVSVDPLFFYVPVLDKAENCLDVDERMQTTASVLRSITDIFYAIHMVFQFRTGFIAPSSRVFGRGVLVEDRREIARRYLSSHFIIDILAVLPLPQMVISIIIPCMRDSDSKPLHTKNMLKFIVFFQYIPRFMRIYPLYKQVTRTSGILTETAWAGAAFNLFLYMLASHVFGAFWYLFSIERKTVCWKQACNRDRRKCNTDSLYCRPDKSGGNTFLNESCPALERNATSFDFGIFLGALQSGVVESHDFPQKFFYCFWWGLQNLSSLGQNLKTSKYIWEICFAVFISISGLVLFSFLIGNMQTYLQSTTTRLEEMRVKRRDAEQWMSHRLLPENLRKRIRRYEQYKWQETRGVNEENLLSNLPKDLRRDIKRHLCLALVMRVPMFEQMDEQLLDALCDRLQPVLYTEESYIVREGDPVDEMLFIMRGKLLTMTTNGGRTGFFNSEHLGAGDFCGEELLTWALDPHTSTNLPISTRTVQALVEVEAFALKADNLKFVASQFRRLHSKQLRHTFRFYSQQWRTWAACFIQAFWRRCVKKRLEESLREEENRLQDALAKEACGSSPSFGTTMYASRFAANILRTVRKSGSVHKPRMLERMTPMLLLQKPAEPDFNSGDYMHIVPIYKNRSL